MLSPKPLSLAMRRGSAGCKRQPESPKIAALKAAIVAAAAEGYVQPALRIKGSMQGIGSGAKVRTAACDADLHSVVPSAEEGIAHHPVYERGSPHAPLYFR